MEDKLDIYFKSTDFDVDVPRLGHFNRFEERLNPQKRKAKFSTKWMGVAASIILIVGVWIGTNLQQQPLLLADVSPEMQETELFFVTTIKQELKEIEKFRNPATERVIEDALYQLENLDDEYKKLVIDLNKSFNDKRIVFAMIKNYQNRIEILQNVLLQIDEIKNLKTNNNESYI